MHEMVCYFWLKNLQKIYFPFHFSFFFWGSTKSVASYCNCVKIVTTGVRKNNGKILKRSLFFEDGKIDTFKITFPSPLIFNYPLFNCLSLLMFLKKIIVVVGKSSSASRCLLKCPMKLSFFYFFTLLGVSLRNWDFSLTSLFSCFFHIYIL